MEISDIDKNLKINTGLNLCDVKYYDAEDEPFKIFGVFRENDCFRRLPEKLSSSISPYIDWGAVHTAGGRVRFLTDSEYVAINAEMRNLSIMNHCAPSGSCGFDMFEKAESAQKYLGTFLPTEELETETQGYENVIHLGSRKMRDIIINFPLYAGVKKLHIGLEDSATVTEGGEYKYKKPVVYYGSSITQGGCASKPGSSYQAILSSHLDCDYINLGFSGNALGEDCVAEYIAELDMSVFVYDYDHNAPDVEHLKNTHLRFFNIIREKNPNIPIIIMSRPKYYINETEEQRLKVIKETYDAAIARGDKNVYFIPGTELMDDYLADNGTVDGCHPTDSGFLSMARRVEPLLKSLL